MKHRFLSAAIVLGTFALASLVQAADLTVTATPNTSNTLPCGPLTMMCARETQAKCVNHEWKCLPIASSSSSAQSQSSSSSSLECHGAFNMMCVLGTQGQCVNGHWSCVRTTQSAPVISTISPAEGTTHTRVMIVGTGFSRTGNVVHFADSMVPNLRSRDGKHISFSVPTQTSIGCSYMKPHCVSPVLPYAAGTYNVFVETVNGSSNTMPFSITK